MSYQQMPNQRLAQVHYLAEATPNTFQPASDHTAVSGPVQATFSVNEQEDIIREAGRPVPTDVGYHSAHISGQIDLAFRFGVDIFIFLAAAMRDSPLPAEAAITPTVDFIALADGAHADGTTGAQLRVTGTNGAFDGLNAASSQDDSRNALWRISLAATAGNDSASRGPVLVKAGNPRDVGADTVADLDPRLFGAADGWGGDWAAADAADEIELDAGAYLGLRNAAPAGNPTYSLICRFVDISTPQYFTLTGVTFGGPSFSFNGRGQITLQLPFVGAGWSNLSTDDPITGNYTDGNAYRRPIRGGSEVTKILLASDSALVALEGDQISLQGWGAPSTANVVHDTNGQTGPAGYTLPGFDPTLSFNYMLKNEATPKAVQLQEWANAHTPLTAILEFTDSGGNVIYLKADEFIPASSIIPTVGGGDGHVTGSFSGKAKEKSRNDLAWTVHSFAA